MSGLETNSSKEMFGGEQKQECALVTKPVHDDRLQIPLATHCQSWLSIVESILKSSFYSENCKTLAY